MSYERKFADSRKWAIAGSLSLLASAMVWAGCGGGTENAQTNSDFPDSFNDTDTNVGSISLDVKQTDMAVGDFTGFSVRATDANGAGVPGLQVVCDTEIGLALIEPTTGVEITDSFGQISGKVGCNFQGSYQMACRLPIGLNKRKFETIRCNGSSPDGFGGFAGAGGGGLGTGGSAIPDDPDTDDGGGLSLSSINVFDEQGCSGGATGGTTSIDITQGLCGTAQEPFFDTHGSFTVANNSTVTWQFTSLNYTVEGVNGSSFTSSNIALNGSVPPDGTASFCVIIFDAAGGGKRFIGATSNISFTGVRNVTFRLRGVNDQGEEVTITGRTALSFDNFNTCS